jgi:anti-sigma B factor antagonist
MAMRGLYPTQTSGKRRSADRPVRLGVVSPDWPWGTTRTVPRSLSLAVAREGDVAVVIAAGAADLDTAPDLDECLSSLQRERDGLLIVDCAQLTFCDTSCVAAFARHLPLRFRNPHPKVRRILEISGFADLIDSP